MKKQIVKIGDKYAARYKEWWELSWNYIASVFSFSMYYLKSRSAFYLVLVDTEEQAIKNMEMYFKAQEEPIVEKIIIIKEIN